ncbi:MAG: hypothetical protein ABJH98_11610 [Reichenbachiella sp.]|uniref:hypothetical protein n=1 Tax=Reichenbachiella sp. TaxID=2184521 RepID=UPI003298251B
MKGLFVTILAFCIFTSCKTTHTSMLIADSYDEAKGETTLTLIPYGNIVIPGKWTKYNYNQTSKQHFFRNSDSTAIAVAKNPIDKYPFYSSELSNSELSKNWFEWESDFYSEKGIAVTQTNRETTKEYVIWKAKSSQVNSVFLYGVKNNLAYNFAVVTDNWTDEQRTKFLRELWDIN